MDQHSNGQQNGEEGDGSTVADQLRRWRRVDGLGRLQMRITRAIRTAELIMLSEDSDTAQRLSAVRALTSAVREARKVQKAAEREEKIQQVEAVVEKLNGGA
jgi:hypothetical protein